MTKNPTTRDARSAIVVLDLGGAMDKMMPRKPAGVMCVTKYHSTKKANNVFMKGQKIDRTYSQIQSLRIKQQLEDFGIEVLDIPDDPRCQDQPFTANIGMATGPDKIVLARFKAAGRPEEEAPARQYFQSQGYRVIQPPQGMFFEGEADCKWWKDRTFFGGYGKFSSLDALKWIERNADVEIVPLRETSDKLYHLDCSLAVIDEETFIVNPAGLDSAGMKELEKRGNVIVVPREIADTGATNIIQVPGKRTWIAGGLFPESPLYRKYMDWMLGTADKLNRTVIFSHLSEGDKSGADVSCLWMNLWQNYAMRRKAA